MINRIFLVVLLVAAASAAALYLAYGQGRSQRTPAGGAATPAAEADDGEAGPNADPRVERDVLIQARNAPAAPAISSGEWINSDPLSLEQLRGRVVLVGFWTFGCYNCRNTLPALKRYHEQYAPKGLTIVGVHSPEFSYEKDVNNVRERVRSLGVRYPVVTDNDFKTWEAYRINAWPTVVILDKRGRIRYAHVGEGEYETQEDVIRKLLAE